MYNTSNALYALVLGANRLVLSNCLKLFTQFVTRL